MDSNTRAEIAAIAARQHGAFSTAQARQAGLSDRSLRWCVQRGGYVRLNSTTFAIAGSPATWRRTAMASTLAHGPDAFVSHRAALLLAGLTPKRTPRVEVLIPHHRWKASGPWLVHETRQLEAADRWVLDGIPVTSIERSLIDVGRYWSPQYVGSLLDDAVARGLTTYPRFAARFAELRRRGRPGITTTRLVLADRGLAEGTPFEQQMAALIRRSGLPRPTRELHVRVGERDYFVDFAYPDARLGIECDSTTWHTLPHQIEYDLKRQNEIQGTGILLLRYTRSRLRDDPDAVVAEIRRHLAERRGVGDAA